MHDDMSQPIDLTALAPRRLATLLSNAFRRQVTEEQVRLVAEEGNLLTADDTLNLIRYTAYLASEVTGGRG